MERSIINSLLGIALASSSDDPSSEGNGVFDLDKKEMEEEISLLLVGLIMYLGAMFALVMNSFQFWNHRTPAISLFYVTAFIALGTRCAYFIC